MSKKFKWIFGILILSVCTYVGINIIRNNKKIDLADFYNDKNGNGSLEYVTVQEIRDSKDEVIKELEEGKYDNLISDEIYIGVSSDNEVSYVHEYAGGLYQGITDPLEMYNIEMNIIHYYLGDELLEKFLYDANGLYIDENGNNELYTADEVLSKINEGKYDEICSYPSYGYYLPYLLYGAWTNVDGDNRYVHVQPDFEHIVVIKGKLMEIAGTESEDPESNYEPLAVYYPESENLDDVYELQNGEISIRDAIEFIENYFKNDLPYDISSSAEKKVAKVGVYEISEGNICLEFTIVRKINGMETEYGPMYAMVSYGAYTYEACRAMMVDIDDVDEYIIYNNTLKDEKAGETVTKVVSLKSAVQSVSEKIGKNSVYKVLEARMAYRIKIINDEQFNNEYECVPCWIIRCENQADAHETIFYINLVDGNIDYVTEMS